MISRVMQEASCSHQRESRAREDVADRRALGRGQKCSSHAGNLEKSRQGVAEAWEEGAPLKQSGLQMPPSLHCHMDSF